MTRIPRHLEIAISQIGIKEYPGDPSNPQIEQYLEAIPSLSIKPLSDRIPWCAAFVAWCLIQAHLKPAKDGVARSYLKLGTPMVKPATGCITILKRGKSWQGHVGFYLDESPSFFYILGGNQENRVSIRRYGKWRLLGHRWPDDLQML